LEITKEFDNTFDFALINVFLAGDFENIES
jgi:hypothetical protein